MVWKCSHHLSRSVLFEEGDDSSSDEELYLPKTDTNQKSSFAASKDVGEKLKEEGALLAERGFFKEALTKWNHSLQHIPNDFTLHEMQAQILMTLEKDMASVQAAERSVNLKRNWQPGWQTLGRAQLNIQDPSMALKSFGRALYLQPCDDDVRAELFQTLKLLEKLAAPLQPVPTIEEEAAMMIVEDEDEEER